MWSSIAGPTAGSGCASLPRGGRAPWLLPRSRAARYLAASMTNLRSRRLAVLASGQGGNLRALAGRALDPAFGGAIALVLSDRPDAGAVAVARAAGLHVE